MKLNNYNGNPDQVKFLVRDLDEAQRRIEIQTDLIAALKNKRTPNDDVTDLCKEVLRQSGAYMSGHHLAKAVLKLLGE